MCTRRAWLSALALSLLGGCASHQAARFPDQRVAVENPQQARIYVIRQPTFWRFNLVVLTKSIRVTDGGDVIGSIAGQRGFVSWEREPGDMLLVVGEASLWLTVTKGKVYYVLVRDIARGPFWGAGSGTMTVELEVVDSDKGRKELARSTLPR